MNRSGVSSSSANSHQWKCPARYRTSARAKMLAPSKCSSQRGFVDIEHGLLRLTSRKIRATRILREKGRTMPDSKEKDKQNVTISLDRQTIRKARIVAARRSTSISGLVARQIEVLVGEEEAYELAERQALALLDQGFNLGGKGRVSRDELHER